MQIVYDNLFLIMIFIMIAGLIIIIPLWLLLTFLTPKSLLERYFKEPHFTYTETLIMSHFPSSLMRTSIFSWLLLLQSYGFKTTRQIRDLDNHMPKWYAFLSRFLAVYVAFTIISILLLFATLFGIAYYQGKL